MATFLFESIVFGPVKSRRLGISLGINLLPVNAKICSFDCIYCECGFNPSGQKRKMNLPSRFEVKEELQKKLTGMKLQNLGPDVITFAGNGEPTLHPDFEHIIDDTIEIRDQLAPQARIAVLSNASRLADSKVFNALLKVDDNILKLDSAFPETLQLIDRPNYPVKIEKLVDELKLFNGKVIIQTLFIKGFFEDKTFDNTTETEVEAWIELLKAIKPRKVMIYTIDRDTPVHTLERIPESRLKTIAEKVKAAGFEVQVSA